MNRTAGRVEEGLCIEAFISVLPRSITMHCIVLVGRRGGGGGLKTYPKYC